MDGHILHGFAFFIVGLWHLFNNIRLHARAPSLFSSLVWFPAPGIRYLELYVIIFGCFCSILLEQFIHPARHQPLDSDGTIPSNHLHGIEHSLISLSLLTYAVLAIVFDRSAEHAKAKAKARSGILPDLTALVAAMAFAQQLLLFHLHSADHEGLEGQYHLFIQFIISVALGTILIGIVVPDSFIVIFARSVSILSEGIWLMITGVMLYTPRFMPKGCFIDDDNGHLVARCQTDEALHRAKSLVNIMFSMFLICVTVASGATFLVLTMVYEGSVEYQSLSTETKEDLELQKTSNIFNDESSKNHTEVGKTF